MKTKIYLIIAAIPLMIACSSNSPIQDQSIPEQKDGSMVTLSMSQIEHAGIQFGKIEPRLLSSDVNARGEIVVPPEMEADIVITSPGMVQEIMVGIGEKVSAGQVLATIRSLEFLGLQEEYLLAGNRLSMLEQDYQRQKTLKEENAASEKKFQEAEALYADVLVTRRALEERLVIMGVDPAEVTRESISGLMKVKSPVDGIIEEVNLNAGKYVEPSDVLFKIYNTKDLNIEIMVFEKDIMKVKPRQRVTFQTSDQEKHEIEGYVKSIASSVRTDARVVKVLAGFENEKVGLVPGMFVSTKIHTSEDTLAALPTEAILFDGNIRKYIFYTLPEWETDSTVAFMEAYVVTGFEEDGYTQVTISGGLPGNARIVIKGAYYLKSEKAKNEE